MSTSSIWSARRTISSGTVSRCDRAGDAGDDVVERLEVLDVERRDDVDAGVEQLLDVLPALLVARPRGVGVRVLVDQHHLGPSGQDGVDVHLVDSIVPRYSTVARGHHLEVAELLGGLRRGRGSRRRRPRHRCRALGRRNPSSSIA